VLALMAKSSAMQFFPGTVTAFPLSVFDPTRHFRIPSLFDRTDSFVLSRVSSRVLANAARSVNGERECSF